MLKRLTLFFSLLVLLSACGPLTPMVESPLAATAIMPTENSSSDRLNPDPDSTQQITSQTIELVEQLSRFGKGHILDVALSPDQSALAVYAGENIDIYDTKTFHLKQSIFAGKFFKKSSDIQRTEWNILTFTSDNKKLVFSDGKYVTFWDMTWNTRLNSFVSLVPGWDVVDVALSPNGNRVMLTTLGGSVRCDGRDMNFALYDLEGRLIFDRCTCADYSNNFFRFTEDEKVLFIFASIMTIIYPTRTILVDGVSGTILEQTQAEYLDYEHPQPNQAFLYDISPDGMILAYVTYNRMGEDLDIRTKLVEWETRNVLHEQDGLVEFLVEQGNIRWQTIAHAGLPPKTNVEICDIKASFHMDQYHWLLSGPEHAISVVTHSGQIQTIELWDVPNCKIEKVISYPAAARTIFSNDGHWLAGTDGYHAYVWDLRLEQLHFMVAGKPFESPKDIIQFNADGSRFLTGPFGRDYIHPAQPYRNYTISIFETDTGKLLREINPDGEFLKNIVATPEKDLVIVQDLTNQDVWNIETGQKLASLPVGPSVFATQAGYIWIAAQPQSRSEVVHRIALYNFHTGEQVQELDPGMTQWVRNIYLNSDGTRLLAHLFLGQGKENGDAVKIFDTTNNGKKLLFYKLPWGHYEMSVYGDTFATNDSQGYVNLWNYESSSPTLTLWGNHRNWKVSDQYGDAEDKNSVYAMLVNINWIDTIIFDENILITQGDTLRFWDTTSGNLLADMKPDYTIESLSVSPDHDMIAVVGSDGLIRLWGVPKQ